MKTSVTKALRALNTYAPLPPPETERETIEIRYVISH